MAFGLILTTGRTISKERNTKTSNIVIVKCNIKCYNLERLGAKAKVLGVHNDK